MDPIEINAFKDRLLTFHYERFCKMFVEEVAKELPSVKGPKSLKKALEEGPWVIAPCDWVLLRKVICDIQKEHHGVGEL